jgi:hypothetical protein
MNKTISLKFTQSAYQVRLVNLALTVDTHFHNQDIYSYWSVDMKYSVPIQLINPSKSNMMWYSLINEVALLCPLVILIRVILTDKVSMGHWWNNTTRGKPKYSGGKTCPSATLPTTCLTLTGPRFNTGLLVRGLWLTPGATTCPSKTNINAYYIYKDSNCMS